MSSFTTELQKRQPASGEAGFTLIELLLVLVITGILLAIAVPSFTGLKSRANDGVAVANVRSAIPAVETFYADHDTYAGMTVTNLKLIDAGVRLTRMGTTLNSTTYCVEATFGGKTWKQNGPTLDPTAGACA